MKINKKTQFILDIIENEGLEWCLECLPLRLKRQIPGALRLFYRLDKELQKNFTKKEWLALINEHIRNLCRCIERD